MALRRARAREPARRFILSGIFNPQSFNWLTWIIAIFIAVFVIIAYGRIFPYSDDWSLVEVVSGEQPLTLRWLWAQHNEHRIALPKLLMLATLRISDGDYRAPLLLNLLLLALASALLMWTAARLRGQPSYTDAVFPLLLMGLGQGALGWSFHVQFTSSTAIAIFVLIGIIYIEFIDNSISKQFIVYSLICVGIFMLPCCGGSGLLFAPVLVLFVLLDVNFMRLKTELYYYQRLIINLLATVAILPCLFYLIDYRAPVRSWPAATLLQTLRVALRTLNSGLGPRAAPVWPATTLLLVGLLGASAVLLRRLWQARPEQRRLVGIFAVFLSANLLVAIAVGHARGGRGWEPGLEAHYATLVLPLWCALPLLWISCGPPRARTWVERGLLGVALCAYLMHAQGALRDGPPMQERQNAILQSIDQGKSIDKIINDDIDLFYYVDSPNIRVYLRTLFPLHLRMRARRR